MEPVDIIWFEDISSFNEPVFNLMFLKLSMKQLLLVLVGSVLGYSIAKSNIYAGIAIVGVVFILALVRTKVMPLEQYILSALTFPIKRNHRNKTSSKVTWALLAASGKKRKIDMDRKVRAREIRIE